MLSSAETGPAPGPESTREGISQQAVIKHGIPLGSFTLPQERHN